jgi:hypothetical protein
VWISDREKTIPSDSRSIAVEALGEPRIEEYSESAWFKIETLCPHEQLQRTLRMAARLPAWRNLILIQAGRHTSDAVAKPTLL